MKYLFEENQKFTQWWLWVILLSFPIMSFGPFDENEIKTGLNINELDKSMLLASETFPA